MRQWLTGVRAMAGLTLIEALRQRLWMLFVLAMMLILIQAPSLQAVSQSGRLKLAVVAMTGSINFVITLLAILVAATALRRDLDTRTGFLLFSKPLARSAYLLGRWCGVQLGLLLGIGLLCVVGTATIFWQFRVLPGMRQVIAPVSSYQVSAFAETIPIDESRAHIILNGGSVGDGVVWHFAGLPRDRNDLQVLAHVGVRGADQSQPVNEALVQIQVLSDNPSIPARVLDVSAHSPYGRSTADRHITPGTALVRDRDETRVDLDQDYLRLDLPASYVDAQGGLTVQLTRLESRAILIVSPQTSMRLGCSGGGIFLNLIRGGLVMLAGAGLLAAWTLVCATLANLGVTTLGGLTLYLAGCALPAMREVVHYDDVSLPAKRVMGLAMQIVPDFDRYAVAARLASSEAIGWSVVGSAWMYYGAYSALFLIIAWIMFAKREL
jgi:hypothetical protein